MALQRIKVDMTQLSEQASHILALASSHPIVKEALERIAASGQDASQWLQDPGKGLLSLRSMKLGAKCRLQF